MKMFNIIQTKEKYLYNKYKKFNEEFNKNPDLKKEFYTLLFIVPEDKLSDFELELKKEEKELKQMYKD